MTSPYHLQTNNKIERYHRTIKGEINIVPYEMPSQLEELSVFVLLIRRMTR